MARGRLDEGIFPESQHQPQPRRPSAKPTVQEQVKEQPEKLFHVTDAL